MHIKEIDKFPTSSVYELVGSYFVIYFGFLFVIVMNHSAQERLKFTVKVLKAFLFSWPICVFTIHIFPPILTVIKASICYKDYLTI